MKKLYEKQGDFKKCIEISKGKFSQAYIELENLYSKQKYDYKEVETAENEEVIECLKLIRSKIKLNTIKLEDIEEVKNLREI